MHDLNSSMRLASVAATALLCLLPIRSATAAPQALGLMASNGVPTPLACEHGECSAVFTTFCLQEARPGPSYGDAYAVAPGGDVTLVVTGADGKRTRLPAAEQLRFASLIGFTSMKISLPEATLHALGGTAVAVDVGANVSLLPIERAGDPDPQSAEEIALATGPMREVAARRFETAGAQADAARLTTLLINALPSREAYGQSPDDALWASTVIAQVAAKAAPEGLALAKQVYRGCRIAMESRSALSMRSCLELEHAEIMARENHKFWESVAGY